MGGALLRGVNDAGALDYRSNVGVGFTFNPSLNVTLSNEDLVINGLTPGTVARDSNIVDVNVSTNVVYGYNLSATVGNSSNATQNLVNGDYSFTPLSASAAGLANFGNNEWGYSYSIDNGTNWINGDYSSATAGYGVLPLYTATGVKLAGNSDNAGSSVQFKIAAKAGSSQASGEYNNVINFTAVSNIIPTTMLDAFIASGAKMHNGYFKMQDMTPTICKSIDTDGEKGMQLIDVRDDKVYWVAKLKDGNCWMTQNLDFDIVDGGINLNSTNTDVSSNWEDAGKLADTHGENDTNWNRSLDEPESYDPGDVCWLGEGEYDVDDTCENGHYHLGNFYNWTAAVAMSDSSGYAGDGDDADQSICPAGWRLPLGGSETGPKSFYDLVSQYGWDDSSYMMGGNYTMWGAPLYFPLGGYWNGYLGGVGFDGSYWSSVVFDSDGACDLYFVSDGDVNPDNGDDRDVGNSVRCVAR